MRNGEKVYYCSRLSEENAEVDIYDNAKCEVVRLPNVFCPISFTVQPKNGFTDRMSYGETTNTDQRIIATPYQYWYGKFKVGDVFYLDGAKPNENEEYNGQNANYYVELVNNQNEAIELSLKRIISK